VREDLAEALKKEAGLTDEQARRAVEVFEDFMKERSGEREPSGGLFAGAASLFEDKR
jgi:nucleoid DNA-binding protein